MNFAKILAPSSFFQIQVLHTKANKIHFPKVLSFTMLFHILEQADTWNETTHFLLKNKNTYIVVFLYHYWSNSSDIIIIIIMT